MSRYYDSPWPRYVPVAERRRRAAQKLASLKKGGHEVRPVEIAGRKITTTFWGDAWCQNLESYSDYANRLPRGRTYVRNGSVVDLQIDRGLVRAQVSGTSFYRVTIEIEPLAKQRWTEIKGQCAGQIGSLVELLQGSLSSGVMAVVTQKGEGLFPSPREIQLDCSCPDWAIMCKHVAAALYGVGARLDHEPELLFTLRGLDPSEMVEAAIDQPAGAGKARHGRVLATEDLSSVFGVDIDMGAEGSAAEAETLKAPKTTRKKASSKKASAKKAPAKKASAKKASAKKAPAKKASAKKAPAKKAPAKKAPAKKAPAKKAPAKKAPAKKASAKRVGVRR